MPETRAITINEKGSDRLFGVAARYNRPVGEVLGMAIGLVEAWYDLEVRGATLVARDGDGVVTKLQFDNAPKVPKPQPKPKPKLELVPESE